MTRHAFALAFVVALAAVPAMAQQPTRGTTGTTSTIEGRPSEGGVIDLFALGFVFRPYAYDNSVPACDSDYAKAKVAWRFQAKERQFWNGDLFIADIDKVQEVAPRAAGVNNVPRRYCVGRALMSTGKYHTVRYMVAEDQGMIGLTAGVTSCVVGYDRNWAFGGDCRALRP
jgi:hypothetical protein